MKRLSRKLEHLEIRNVRTLMQDAATIDCRMRQWTWSSRTSESTTSTNAEAVLRTCFRVAKPGASLFLTTNLVGHMSEFYDAYRSVLMELGFADRLTALETHINRRATVSALRTQLEGAGFQFVEAVTRSFQERFVDGTSLLHHHFIRLGFVPGWKSVAPEDSVENVFAALELRLNSIAPNRVNYRSRFLQHAFMPASRRWSKASEGRGTRGEGRENRVEKLEFAGSLKERDDQIGKIKRLEIGSTRSGNLFLLANVPSVGGGRTDSKAIK